MRTATAALPAYSEQRYWEQRYLASSGRAAGNGNEASVDPVGPSSAGEAAVSASGTEWYTGWEALRGILQDPDGPLGSAALRPRSLVLELGCGDSALAAGLASEGFAVLALDFSPTALQLASRQPPPGCCPSRGFGMAGFAAADIRTLPLASGIFDAVVDKGCFDAVQTRDCATMLEEVCRALRPGGVFLCLSSNAALLRSHARKLAGWAPAAGMPLPLPGIEDEVILHCYIKHGSPADHGCQGSLSWVSSAGRVEATVTTGHVPMPRKTGPGRSRKPPRSFCTAAAHGEVGTALTWLYGRIEAEKTFGGIDGHHLGCNTYGELTA